MKLCKDCSRQKFCGNETTEHYCTGYQPQVETEWTAKSKEQNAKELRKAWEEHLKRMEQKKNVKR